MRRTKKPTSTPKAEPKIVKPIHKKSREYHARLFRTVKELAAQNPGLSTGTIQNIAAATIESWQKPFSVEPTPLEAATTALQAVMTSKDVGPKEGMWSHYAAAVIRAYFEQLVRDEPKIEKLADDHADSGRDIGGDPESFDFKTALIKTFEDLSNEARVG